MTRDPVPSLKGPPMITVPFSKSRSINSACSVQYACSRTVLPGVQAAPGAHRITKVFFMRFLLQFNFMNYSLNLCQRFSRLQTESFVSNRSIPSNADRLGPDCGKKHLQYTQDAL